MNARPHPGPSLEPERLLSPSLSSIPNGGEGRGEEALQRSGVQSANIVSENSLLQERAGIKTNTQFSVATQTADPDIRRLLRENPMPGSISLSLEREPNYFADAHLPGETRQTIIARESSRVVCVGNCTTRLRFVNGKPHRVGYLAGLRLDASVAGRFDILRRGYTIFRELQASDPADFYFTSIAADNSRARNFLERNLRGMPRYEFLGEFVTLLFSMERRSPTRRVPVATSVGTKSETGTAKGAEQLNQFNQQFQLAPHWTADQLTALHQLGLRDDDWFGAGALWDQRCFKQTVIRGYAPWLGFLRPTLNLLARLSKRPGLPAVGSILSHAFVLLGAPSSDLNLIRNLRSIAAERGIDWLTLGFAADDPRLQIIRQHFRCREYRSRLYLVRWPGLGGAASDLDRRILAPEVALL